MLLYPGDGSKSSWVCDCIPRYLYFPLNDSCHEAYRQGPCPQNQYVVLSKDEAVPRCVSNPCRRDGVVPFNGTCYPLRTIGGPCAPDGVVGVNETTFQLECTHVDVSTFGIIDAPPRTPDICPAGTRRNMLNLCQKL